MFYKNAAGELFHTYSCYGRGLDILIGAYNFLDLAPKGRDEDDLDYGMAWVRHHDSTTAPSSILRRPTRSRKLRIGFVLRLK